MVKIHAYNPDYNLDLSGATGVVISQRSLSLGSNTPLADSGAGSVGSGPQAAPWDHQHPASGGASSFGSNSTRVSSVPAPGASSSNSRADHVHDGIGTITASSSNTLNRGTTNLRAGTGIALALSNTDGGSGQDTVTITNIAASGGGGGGGSGGWVLLDTQTASAVSNVVFTSGISSTYSVYVMTFTAIIPSTGNVLRLVCSTDGGANYDTGSNYYTAQLSWSTGGVGAGGAGTSTNLTLAPFVSRTISTTANVSTEGHMFMYSLPSSSVYKDFIGSWRSPDSASANPQRLELTGSYNSTTAVNALKVEVSTGTFSGVIRLYGIAQ